MKKKITRKRHLAKTFTWRITATITTTLIGWITTGDLSTGLAIGGIEFFVKMPIYYFHERAWYKSNWGVKKQNNEVVK
ncbi:DUF2061 domain-containing protein [Flavobacteriales bacterium]|nr:DUF2061 domain-containing protein [Flavobacteriales bacterium]